MIYPSINELTKGSKSRYSLVIAVSKRAREIAENAEKNGTRLDEKPVKIAINELAKGYYSYVESDE